MRTAAHQAHERLLQEMRQRIREHRARPAVIVRPTKPKPSEPKPPKPKLPPITPANVAKAKEMERAGKQRNEIAAALGVNRTALWRHLGPKTYWDRRPPE